MITFLEFMVGQLSAREKATLIWILLFSAAMLLKKDFRQAFWQVLLATFQWKMLSLMLMLAAYSVFNVWLLHFVGFWHIDLLKDTLLWIFFGGIITSMSFLRRENSTEILSKITKENLKVVIILEFVVSSYTFPFWIEILLIPALFILVSMQTMVRYGNEHQILRKPLDWAVALLVGTTIIYAIHQGVQDFHKLGSLESVRQILLPPILAFLQIPIIFPMLVLVMFESLFILIPQRPRLSRLLALEVKFKLLVHLRLNPYAAQRFQRESGWRLMHISSIEDYEALLTGQE